MRRVNHLLLVSGFALILSLSASDLLAQNNQGAGRQRQGGGRQRQGNVDPAQFQQRMMERYKERLEVTDDAEWKALQPLVQRVLDARMAVASGARAMLGRGPRPGGDANQADQSQRRGGAPSNPAAEALQKAIDSKAPTAQIKAELAKYLEYRKTKQAELQQAQDELRKVLTSRQEAIAVLSGLL